MITLNFVNEILNQYDASFLTHFFSFVSHHLINLHWIKNENNHTFTYYENKQTKILENEKLIDLLHLYLLNGVIEYKNWYKTMKIHLKHQLMVDDRLYAYFNICLLDDYYEFYHNVDDSKNPTKYDYDLLFKEEYYNKEEYYKFNLNNNKDSVAFHIFHINEYLKHNNRAFMQENEMMQVINAIETIKELDFSLWYENLVNNLNIYHLFKTQKEYKIYFNTKKLLP